MLKHNLTKHYIDIQSVKFRHFCLDSFDILWLGLGALKYMSDLKMHMWLWRSNLQLPVSTLNLFQFFDLLIFPSVAPSICYIFIIIVIFGIFFIYLWSPFPALFQWFVVRYLKLPLPWFVILTARFQWFVLFASSVPLICYFVVFFCYVLKPSLKSVILDGSFTHFNLRFNQQVKCTVDFHVSTLYL